MVISNWLYMLTLFNIYLFSFWTRGKLDQNVCFYFLNEIEIYKSSFKFNLNICFRHFVVGLKLSSPSPKCKVSIPFPIKWWPPCVNFINVKRTNFLYECCFGSFYYVHVPRKKAAKMMFVRKINVDEIDHLVLSLSHA